MTSWEASHQADCKCMNVFLFFVASPVFNSGGGTRGRHANGKPQGVFCILVNSPGCSPRGQPGCMRQVVVLVLYWNGWQQRDVSVRGLVSWPAFLETLAGGLSGHPATNKGSVCMSFHSKLFGSSVICTSSGSPALSNWRCSRWVPLRLAR